MSKAARKNRPPTKQAKPHRITPSSTPASYKQGQNLKFVFLIVAILAAIPFSMGKYFEFNSPGPFDSASNVYSAKHILDGARIGIEEKPSAALGTLLVNILGVWIFGFNEIGPKLIQTVLQAAALLLMFIAMRKLFGKLPAAVGVIVASVYLSAPLIAKFGNVKEQYMIAFMVMAISCLVLHQLGGGWWYAILAGTFASWAPLFKETGISAIAAMGLFVVAQPFLKHRTCKQTTADIGLLVAGAVIAIAPLYVWIIGWDVQMGLPYSFAWKPIASAFESSPAATEQKPVEPETSETAVQDNSAKKGLLMKLLPGYVGRSWQLLKAEQRKEVALRVIRYYRLLILPIALAAGAIVARIARMICKTVSTQKIKIKTYDRFVLLFAVWWLLDMAFVWISPRSYEQYYLPLNASAAMLGGYVPALYWDKAKTAIFKGRWVTVGLVGLLCMVVTSWHIFLGIKRSPHSGTRYKAPNVRRGYKQRLEDITKRKKENAVGAWEIVGEYIHINSKPADKIYVWGWFPGIYVRAQRLSPTPEAFTSEMHTQPPAKLAEKIRQLVESFEQERPKFIVDTHKYQFPWDRPPLELWPRTPKGFLPPNKQIIDRYDAAYSKMLHDKIEPDQALRYEAMKPLREFVMRNYKIVRPFGQHVLFQLKTSAGKEQQ